MHGFLSLCCSQRCCEWRPVQPWPRAVPWSTSSAWKYSDHVSGNGEVKSLQLAAAICWQGSLFSKGFITGCWTSMFWSWWCRKTFCFRISVLSKTKWKPGEAWKVKHLHGEMKHQYFSWNPRVYAPNSSDCGVDVLTSGFCLCVHNTEVSL